MQLLFASKRGFCSGVRRAIDIAEQCLTEKSPQHKLYVYHEIVHNKVIVNRLQEAGITFIDDLSSIPESLPKSAYSVIFSAHGVSPQVREQARNGGMDVIDATCPLVDRVHLRARQYLEKGYQIIYIGHSKHDEVIGVLGEDIKGKMFLVSSNSDVDKLLSGCSDVADYVASKQAASTTKQTGNAELSNAATDNNLSSKCEPNGNFSITQPTVWLSQTTLSLHDTKKILSYLREKLPNIEDPASECICRATTERQNAALELVREVGDDGLIIVVGSANSSNTVRLADLAGDKSLHGIDVDVWRIDSADELDLQSAKQYSRIGITSGASVPEDVTISIIDALRELD